MYPDLLKRLDDANDSNRCFVAEELWPAYFRAFGVDYQVDLYRIHLVETVRGLLVHLDDCNPDVQNSVLGLLLFIDYGWQVLLVVYCVEKCSSTIRLL